MFKDFPIFSMIPNGDILRSRMLADIGSELEDMNDGQIDDDIIMKRPDALDNFFGEYIQPRTGQAPSIDLVHKYLEFTDKSIESLKKFPEIGKLFIKYNTPIMSSAACESLFSVAKYVFSSNRVNLSDTAFEAQLMLKLNNFTNN